MSCACRRSRSRGLGCFEYDSLSALRPEVSSSRQRSQIGAVVCRRAAVIGLPYPPVAGGGSDPAERVSTSCPDGGTSTVCSHCADRLWSLVTIVQPSASSRIPGLPALIIEIGRASCRERV